MDDNTEKVEIEENSVDLDTNNEPENNEITENTEITENNEITENSINSEEEYNDNNFVDNQFGNNGNKELIKKLAFFMAILLAGGLVIGFILWFISLFQGSRYTYEDVEKIMKEASQSYFSDHKKSLPKEKQIVEIGVSTLVKNEYMDPITKYLGEDSKCTGKVRVKKIDSKYVYTPYLNCGPDYSPIELYKTVKKKTVSGGSGLYKTNNGYVFRGEKLKNFVKLDRYLWRIVKINSDNEIMLIKYTNYESETPWDNRYNINNDNNAGINNYKASRIKDFLYKAYNNKDKYQKILTAKDKEKLTTFDLCIGKRDIGNTSKDNEEECSDIYKNQKIGLITVSDYMYASLDNNCKSSLDYACQNYNYLNNFTNWYTVTGVENNSYEVFYVESGGELHVQEAMNSESFRPVIMLNNSVMVKKGTGARSNPYILK